MASFRIRNPFKYPSDDVGDDDDGDLDEEHQERLIADLKASDAKKNEQYRTIFLIIPLSASLFFAVQIFTAATPRQQLSAFLALSCSTCAAYILYFMPIEAPERKGKRPIYQIEAEKGPLERYIIWLSAALALLMLFSAAISWRANATAEFRRELLPCGVLALTLFVRQQLAPIDLEQLQNAKYALKGA